MLVRSWEIWNLTNVLNARNIETFGDYAQEGAFNFNFVRDVGRP